MGYSITIKPCKSDDIIVDAAMSVESQFSVVWIADGTWSNGKPFNTEYAKGLCAFLHKQLIENDNSIIRLEAAYENKTSVERRTIDLTNQFLWPVGTSFKDKQIGPLLKTFKQSIASFNYPISIRSIALFEIDTMQTLCFVSYLFRYANAKMRRVFNPDVTNRNGLRLTSSLRIIFEKPVFNLDDIDTLCLDQYVTAASLPVDVKTMNDAKQRLIQLFGELTDDVQEIELSKTMMPNAHEVESSNDSVKPTHCSNANRIDPEIDVQVENMKNSQIMLLAKMYLQREYDADRQSKLKSSLPFERCALSDWNNWEAAHVKQRSDCVDVAERFDKHNVIPLSPNLHDAFDRNEFGIDLSGTIIFSSKLSMSRRGQLETSMHRRTIDVRHVLAEYLAWRFDQFKGAEAK
jgi:hypothetical protein